MRETKKEFKTVELVKTSYQPTRAEIEEGFTINSTLEDLTKAMVNPVKVRWIDQPRKRR
jgi:hypothetical protein